MVSNDASQHQGPGFDSQLGSLSVQSLHVLPVSAWVSSRSSNFLPQSKDVLVRCIGRAKFSLSASEQVPKCGTEGDFHSNFIAVLM